MAKQVKQIQKQGPLIKRQKRVCAYARVSMETERLNHSLFQQVNYYSKLIKENPEWRFCGVYADNGITGTKNTRDEFQKMLQACRAGEVDIVLTKSISRFARNTLDLLEVVRELKALGVEVRFEKENINTLTSDGELMLTLLASFAQEEARSISENVKWGTRKRFKQGIPNGRFRIFGYEWQGTHLVVVPDEAKVVKRIFENFLEGKSRLETERELNGEGITTRAGCKWQDSNIKCVLNNITYTGNLLFQKEYIKDPITKKRCKNKGELPQYFIENSHEAIIDYDTWKFVQDEMERRRELGPLANKSLNTCCFTGKIKCPYCGLSYMHSQRKSNVRKEDIWVCGSRKKKKVGDGCPVGGTINHKKLKETCARVLGLDEFDEAVFLEKVDFIEVKQRYELTFHMKDGTVVVSECINTGHQDCWTAEARQRKSEYMKKRWKEKRQNGSDKNSKDDTCN